MQNKPQSTTLSAFRASYFRKHYTVHPTYLNARNFNARLELGVPSIAELGASLNEMSLSNRLALSAGGRSADLPGPK